MYASPVDSSKTNLFFNTDGEALRKDAPDIDPEKDTTTAEPIGMNHLFAVVRSAVALVVLQHHYRLSFIQGLLLIHNTVRTPPH